MSPSDRGEMLTKAEDMINTHREIAIEGQTAVNILYIFIKTINLKVLIFLWGSQIL